MHIAHIGTVPKIPLVTPLFTGDQVTEQALLADEGRGYSVRVINFGRGVRNKYHSHDTDQILVVTAGEGYVATEEHKRRVTVGDVIVFSAGEKHWHGATEDSGFSHIYIRPKSGKTTQLEG